MSLRQGRESFCYLMEAGNLGSNTQGLAGLAGRNTSRALLILIKIMGKIDEHIEFRFIYVMSIP